MVHRGKEREQGCRRGRGGQVSGKALDLRLGIRLLKLLDGGVNGAIRTSVYDHPRAFHGQPAGNSEADAFGGAGR